MKRIICLAFLFIVFIPAALVAADFGAVISGQFRTEVAGETDISGKATLAPWLSVPAGEADFNLSFGVFAGYEERFSVIPDLFRLEFSFKPLAPLSIRAGRFSWQDPSRFVAKGNFDGLDLLLDLGKVRLGAAVLYTGFLYQGSTDINISPSDTAKSDVVFDWVDFANTYFAPRRLLTALYGDFPGFPFQRGSLCLGFMAQFDLTDAAEAFHTQYIIMRYTFVYKSFDLFSSGAVEFENTLAEGLKAAYAFTIETGWQTGFRLKDRLSTGLRWSSGEGPYAAAFFPLFREAQGMVLKPSFSGIMTLWAQYKVRVMDTVSMDLTERYFFRTDSTSFADPDLNDTGYALGLEFGGSMLWVPFSDLSFSLAGGFFFPQAGNAMDGPVRWSLTLGTILSF